MQQESGYDITSFAFITDVHWNNNAKKSPDLLRKVVSDCNIPYVIDGGDLASNPLGVPKDSQINELKEAKKAFGLNDKILRAVGNHDDNSINSRYSMTITDKNLYDILYREKSGIQKIKSGATGAYSYVDDQVHKIRYIVLNAIDIPYIEEPNDALKYKGMSDWVFRQEQVDWFADVALNVPSNDYRVVVCSHVPINSGLIKNDSIVMNILQAFKDKTTYTGNSQVGTDFEVTKTVDFSNAGGDVICWIAGHNHVDNFIQMPANITFKQIITLNDSLDSQPNQPLKIIGTTTEQAFDIFTINKMNRTVNITRIGAGSDRVFSY